MRFTRFLVIAALAAAPVFAEGSCWLRDAVSPAPSMVYALCEQGVLWTTADGGSKWASLPIRTDAPLRAVAFVDASHGVVVGDGGTILGSDDGGKTWAARPSGTKEKLMDVAFIGNEGWASGMNGTMIHTADGGRTWARQKTGTTQAIEGLFFLDARHGWAVGWAGTILRTVDGGENWKMIIAAEAQWSMSGIYFKDDNTGWAVGFAGQILQSKDGGQTWKVQASPTKGSLSSIAFGRDGHGWITFDDGFLTSQDGGETWKVVPTDGRYFLARLLRMNDRLWALGQSVMLQHVGGNEWKRVEALVPNTTMQPGKGDSQASR